MGSGWKGGGGGGSVIQVKYTKYLNERWFFKIYDVEIVRQYKTIDIITQESQTKENKSEK